MIDRFQIFDLDDVEWGTSTDRRPVIVVSPQGTLVDPRIRVVHVAPLSGQMDLFDKGRHFLVTEESPGFEDTGLRRASYVGIDTMFLVPKAALTNSRGELGHDLARQLAEFVQHYFRY